MFSLAEERFMRRHRREEMFGWMMNGVNRNDRKGLEWTDG